MRTLHDKVRAEDTHGGDTNTRLGGTVRSTQAGEDNGTGATHGAEKGLLVMLAGLIIDSHDCEGLVRRLAAVTSVGGQTGCID